MAKVVASIGRGLGGVTRFSGRDTPGQFWPWAIFVFILSTIASFTIMLPPMMRAMLTMFRTLDEANRAGSPEPSPEEVSQAFMTQYAAELEMLALPMAAVNLVSALLLAAAIVRRLHDRDRTGLWALMPLPFMLISILYMPAAMAVAMGRRDLPPLEMAASSAGSFYMLTLIVLIVLLVGSGTDGPNRFGPDPRETA